MTLKLTSIGNSTGIVLPIELLNRMRLGKGDLVHATETADGIVLSPYNPEFAAQVDAAERVMREDRDALRKLAG